MNDRLAQLQSLLQAEPNDVFCLYGIAMEHARQGRFEEAIACYDRALAVDPAYCYAYFHKAKAQEEAGDQAGACKTLQEGLMRSKAAGDSKAANEIAAYLDEIS